MDDARTDDKSHAESIATDIFGMIEAARSQPEIDVNGGFQNRPLQSPGVTITYLFYPRAFLVNAPGMPDSFKRGLGPFNVLATLDGRGGKKLGIFHICRLEKPFDAVENVNEVLAGIRSAQLDAFSAMLRQALKDDIDAHLDGETDGTVH